MPSREGPPRWILGRTWNVCQKSHGSVDFGKFPAFATKKNPQAVQAPGVREKLLPQLRLLCWAAGVSGDGDAAQPA